MVRKSSIGRLEVYSRHFGGTLFILTSEIVIGSCISSKFRSGPSVQAIKKGGLAWGVSGDKYLANMASMVVVFRESVDDDSRQGFPGHWSGT